MSGWEVVLQTDLQGVIQEAKRKWPLVKEAAEKVLEGMKSFHEHHRDVCEELSKSEHTWKPFILAWETRHGKLISLTMNWMIKMIQQKAVHEDGIKAMVTVMENKIMVVQAHHDLQLKGLQMLTMIVVNYYGEKMDGGEYMALMMKMCFEWSQSSTLNVKNTASATLRQMVIFMMEKADEERKDANLALEHEMKRMRKESYNQNVALAPVDLKGPNLRDAYLFFQDLCILLEGGEKTVWLKISMIDKLLGLELMEAALSSRPDLFNESPDYMNLVKDKVCALALYFTDRTSYAVSMRLTRLIAVILRMYHISLPMECEIFVAMLIKLLDLEIPRWQRILVLEVFKSLCTEYRLFRELFIRFDAEKQSAKIITNMINAMAQHAQILTADQLSTASVDRGSDGENSDFNVPKIACLDQFDKLEPLIMSERYAIYLIFQSMSVISHGMVNDVLMITNSGYSQHGGFLVSYSQVSLEKNQQEFIDIILKMANVFWPGMVAILCLFVETIESTIHIQARDVLLSLENLVILHGILELKASRDAFIKTICKLGLSSGTHDARLNPNFENVYVSKLNFLALKTLVNLGYQMGEFLDEGWLILLECFQDSERLFRSLSVKANKPIAGGAAVIISPNVSSSTDPMSLEGEIKSYQDLLSQFFEQLSQRLQHRGFCHFVQSLCRLSQESIASGSATFIPSDGGPKYRPSKTRPIMFSVEKLRIVCQMNLKRFSSSDYSKVWEIAIAHFIELCSNASSINRTQAIESLTQIMKSCASSLDKNNAEMQTKIFNVLKVMLRSPSANLDVRLNALECVYTVLQTAGQMLNSGAWEMFFDLIRESMDRLSSEGIRALAIKDIARLAFQSLQYVCSDFLVYLNSQSLKLCINTLGLFACLTEENGLVIDTDVNISLTAIGLLWNVADFLSVSWSQSTNNENSNLRKNELRELWVELLMSLWRIMQQTHADVRNGAVQTLFRAFNIHGDRFDTYIFEKALKQIIYPLMTSDMVHIDDASQLPKIELDSEDRLRSDFIVQGTRVSFQAQLEETKVLIVQGLIKIFLDFFDNLFVLEDFEVAWRQLNCFLRVSLLHHIRSGAFTSPSTIACDVTLAASSGFLSICNSKLWWQDKALDNPKRTECFQALLRITFEEWIKIIKELANIDQTVLINAISNVASFRKGFITSPLNQRVLTLFADCFDGLHASLCRLNILHPRDVSNSMSAFGMLITMVTLDYPSDYESLTVLQQSIHQKIEKIIGEHSNMILVLPTLLSWITMPLNSNMLNRPHLLELKHSPTLIAFAQAEIARMIDIFKKNANLLELYNDQEPIFQNILSCFAVLMHSRYECPKTIDHNDSLFRLGALGYLQVSQLGIQAMFSYWEDLGLNRVVNQLQSICLTFQQYLLADNFVSHNIILSEYFSDEKFDIELCSILLRDISSFIHLLYQHQISINEPAILIANVIESFLGLFYNASYLDPGQRLALHKTGICDRYASFVRSELAQFCLEILFIFSDTREHALINSISHSMALRDQFSKIATRLLLSRCQEIIHNYILDSKCQFGFPLSRLRRQELLSIFTRLQTLKPYKSSNSEISSSFFPTLHFLLLQCVALPVFQCDAFLFQKLHDLLTYITPIITIPHDQYSSFPRVSLYPM